MKNNYSRRSSHADNILIINFKRVFHNPSRNICVRFFFFNFEIKDNFAYCIKFSKCRDKARLTRISALHNCNKPKITDYILKVFHISFSSVDCGKMTSFLGMPRWYAMCCRTGDSSKRCRMQRIWYRWTDSTSSCGQRKPCANYSTAA